MNDKKRKFKRKNKIPREVAEEQVEMLNDYYDVDEDFLVEAMEVPLKDCLMGITKSVCRGRLSIEESESGVVLIQHLEKQCEGENKVTYKEVGAKVRRASDNATGNAKISAVLAAMSGQDADFFDKLGTVDRSTAEDVGNYFLFA